MTPANTHIKHFNIMEKLIKLIDLIKSIIKLLWQKTH